MNDKNSSDYGNYELLKYLARTDSIRVSAYEEVILATTSEELKTIPEILSTLNYIVEVYLKFKELITKYK